MRESTEPCQDDGTRTAGIRHLQRKRTIQNFDFDKGIDRKRTNSLKYDFAVERGYPEDVLPLWVTDMDFQLPPSVREALACPRATLAEALKRLSEALV